MRALITAQSTARAPITAPITAQALIAAQDGGCMKITDALKGEHGVFYAQFELLEEVVAPATLPVLKAQGAILAAGLTPHAQMENDLLFPALEAHLGTDGPTAAFRAEHAEIESAFERLRQLRELNRDHNQIDAALARLPETPSLAEARDLIDEIVHAAREHFAKEEQMLFPMAEQLLGERTLEELGAEWARRRSVVLA